MVFGFVPSAENPAYLPSREKMLRVTAWAMRFARLSTGNGKHLTVTELMAARDMWVKYVQRIHSKEMENGGKPLGVFRNEDSVMRCAGRFNNAEQPINTKYPILFPKNEWFTTLVIQSYHKRSLHAGVNHTLAQIRNALWIPRGRARVKCVIHKCRVCKRWEGKPFRMPTMAPLPKKRLERALPFAYTGLDYLGPIHVNNGNGETKTWVCLFTCLAARSVHLGF